VSLSEGDLRAYFERIGFSGEARPDRATLEGLVAAHTGTIPFENLNPFLGLPVPLAPDALVAKLVRQRRGGYCYEQNGLFSHVLETIGFDFTPRTHKLLLVNFAEGLTLADVGFGGAVCTGVLDLVPEVAQPTPHERFRLVEVNGMWRQQIEIGGEWRSTYQFDLTPQLGVDDELGNWWTSASPASHFTFSLIAARSPAGRRHALRNFDYSIHVPGGDSEKRRLGSPEEVCAVLEQDFGIEIPDCDRFVARLQAIA
jgi:N-hydroxyarylamine O-acetyltransferase